MIMEQVEYPGMSGSNTICVATALLETGMLPMTEPVTELDARGARRPDPRHGHLPGRQGHRRHVPQRARVRDAPGRAGGGAAARAPSRSMSRGAACSTSIADATPFGLRLTPDEGRGHHADHRDDQGRGRGTAAGRPSRSSPAFAGITIGAAVGPAARSGRTRWRNVVTVSTGEVDWRRRRRGPASSTGRRAARAPARGWRRSTPRAGSASARTSATRASWARSSRDGCSRRRTVGPYRAVVPDDHRHGLDHRVRVATSSTPATRSPRASPSATSGLSDAPSQRSR